MSWRAFALVTRSEARVHSGEWVVEGAWGLATGLQWPDGAPSRGFPLSTSPPVHQSAGQSTRGLYLALSPGDTAGIARA